jgi:hypothetical protein
MDIQKKTIEKTIEVNVACFDDGQEIDMNLLYKFIDVAADFEDTIDCVDNYTDAFFYFVTKEERELEQLLLKYDVIREVPSKNISTYNYPHTPYWLSKGYLDFKEKFFKCQED